jgi:cyclopropane-fatty-acyl-phospholipid synthase
VQIHRKPAVTNISRLQEFQLVIPPNFADQDLAYLLSQYYYGEEFAVRAAKLLLELLSDRLATNRYRFEELLKEELHHAAAFKEFLERRLNIYPHHQATRALLQEIIESGDAIGAALVLHVVVEPFGLGSLVCAGKGLIDEQAIALFELVAKDEAKHLSLLPDILAATDLHASEQQRLKSLVLRAISVLSQSTVAEPVFRSVWPTRWESEVWQSRALNSSFYAQQAKRVAALILGQIKKVWFLEPDLAEFKQVLTKGFAEISQRRSQPFPPVKPQSRHPHYDDGNQLFMEMIGPSMAYSCANWDGASTLEQAQAQKFSKIAEYSGVNTTTQSIVDLGCGWGGYVAHLAKSFPQLARIDGMTVSQQQADWFKQNNQDFRASTWRQSCFDYLESLDGKFVYDAASSIEALEHFANAKDYKSGRHRDIYRYFFQLIRKNCAGRIGIETIVATASMSDLPKDLAKKAMNFALFMLREVYPDSHLSSPADIVACAEPLYQIDQFEVHHLDYARTCQAWLDRLEQIADRFNPARVEVYRKYLRLCVEQFESKSIGLLQASLSPRSKA